jgi:hypothetical protein
MIMPNGLGDKLLDFKQGGIFNVEVVSRGRVECTCSATNIKNKTIIKTSKK